MRAAGLAILAALLLVTPALAHAVVASSDPADGAVLAVPPTAIVVRFSEPVQPFGVGLTLVGPDGRPVAADAVRVDGAQLVLPVRATQPGTYRARWQVVAGDTHPARGTLTFAVGAPTATPTAEAEVGGVTPVGLLVQAAARWLHFVGFALGFGGVAFGVLVLRPLGAFEPAAPVVWRLANSGLALLLAAEPLALVGHAASYDVAAALDPAAVSSALDSSFGRAMGARLGAALLLWVLVGTAQGGAAPAEPLALVVGWVLAVLDGGSAHAASLQPIWLGLLVNALHLSAMALWVGGVGALVLVRGVLGAATWRRAAARFGRLAIAAVGVLGLSGLAMALTHLTAVADLVGSPYGGALTLKTALVAAVGALGVLARRRLEAVGMALVLATAGLLVSLPPPA
ncbi:MAG TPA: copper resistance protein CopC [Chloroflexota bacterium]|nr:copper resistance protein CopC [Chloroflexota bacterium]